MTQAKKKPRATTVAVTVNDIHAMRRSDLGLSPVGVKKAAKTRAAARELFCECGSTVVALKAMTSGVTHAELKKFCMDFLKAA